VTKIEKTALVPYTPQQMYELVNRVDDYPAFVPLCSDATIHSESETELHATIVLAMAGLSHSLSTRNAMQPGKSIALSLVKGPFRDLSGMWRFEPGDNGGCKVSLQMEFAFANRLLAISLGKVFETFANSMVSAFCKRAERSYGRG
jgi:ribosome-associated toxin RatA of RatAB toxin-antitoxin module